MEADITMLVKIDIGGFERNFSRGRLKRLGPVDCMDVEPLDWVLRRHADSLPSTTDLGVVGKLNTYFC